VRDVLIMVKITKCPTCGSSNIKKVKRDWSGNFKGQQYVVPSLKFHECPGCGEKIFDREAMRKIEAISPAFLKSRKKKLH
jgi:YgiT-type zinc finger domain-containing protein